MTKLKPDLVRLGRLAILTAARTGKNTGIFRERVQNLRISRQIRKKAKNNSGLTAEYFGDNSGLTAEFAPRLP
jgi:hypothetical protein